ncbi:hypothetical protein [Burkholderia ubonensis]|uniref:hypothetical protein n=1 Tax=Burkholderia ubonensis TaxID=101571 RepID=UPI000ACEEB10|nr:hypothetical protein [Burkholderia ubonensis]VWB57624.1 hypothetical protein BUB20358_02647 [Burkholderia ubonensis]
MAIDKLNDYQMVNTAAAAMAPYRCVAEFGDYRARFGFAVYYGEGEDERQVFEYRRREVDRAAALIAALNDARNRMSAIGIDFPHWDNTIRD